MQAEVMLDGAKAGILTWETDSWGAQVTVDCAMPQDHLRLLRCYGETGGAPLLIGLPEPRGGRLVLSRHLSAETLKAAGCFDAPPTAFYLAEQMQSAKPPSAPPTIGDSVLDALIAGGQVDATWEGDAVVLCCPFASDKPFALAPVFVLCAVQDGKACLHADKKDAAAWAASFREVFT